MNFPLQQDVRRRPKTPLLKFKKEKKKGKGQITNAWQSYQAKEEGGFSFFAFSCAANPVFNVMRIYSKPCKMNDSSFFEFESVYLCI